jgi:hypothetical protein
LELLTKLLSLRLKKPVFQHQLNNDCLFVIFMCAVHFLLISWDVIAAERCLCSVVSFVRNLESINLETPCRRVANHILDYINPW